MNFQQLEYIIAVHENKHFGHAAESCHVTQATLSGMIKKLESELGLMLFDRSSQPIITTDAGKECIEIAKKILAHKNQLLATKDIDISELEGDLTIGVIPTIANSLLPIILPPLLKTNPLLRLTIKEITTDEIKQQLVMDKIDLGILATPLEENQLEESILYYEAMMIYGVKGSEKNYVSSKDIQNNKVWLLEEGHCFRNQSVTVCDIKEKINDDNNLNFEGSTFDTLLNLTNKFGGITLIPELYYNEMSDDKKAITKSFQTPIPVREVSLVSYRPYTKTKTVDFLTQEIKKLIEPHLSTLSYPSKDLDIIGI